MQNEKGKQKGTKDKTHRSWGRVEKLPSGNYRASFKAPNGKRYKAPHTFKEKKDANAWLNRNKADIDKAEANGIKWISPAEKEKLEQQNSITVEQLIDLWLTESDSITKESTRQVHRRRMNSRVLNHPLAQMPVAKVTRHTIKEWWKYTTTTYPEQPTTNRAAYTCLKTAFEHARLEMTPSLVDVNPVEVKGATKKPKTKILDRPVLKKEEIDAIVTHINERLKAPILILAYAGLRIGEALELRRKDLEDDGTYITITVSRNAQRIKDEATGRQIMKTFDTTKTEAGERSISLPPKVSARVRQHLNDFVGEDPEGFLITTATGQRYMDTSFRSRFKTAAKAAGREDVGLHDFRRYFATTLSTTEDVPEHVIRRLMGHTTTKQVDEYLRAEKGFEQAAADRLNELL